MQNLSERLFQKDTISENTANRVPARRALITGAAGFIGGHFVQYCQKRWPEMKFVVLDKLTYAANLQRWAVLGNCVNVELIKASIEDEAAVMKAMAGCDGVVHFAAETHVPRSFDNAELFYRTNVTGTRSLVRCALATGCKRFVHISTDEVYGPTKTPVAEVAALGPTTPYAESKMLAEEAVVSANGSGLNSVIVRPTNVVGTGQNDEKVIPKFMARAILGRDLTIEGGGDQTRNFLPVSDLVRAIELVWLNAQSGDIFNVAGRDIISIKSLARKIVELTGSQSRIVHTADRQVNDADYLISDKKLKALGFEHRSCLDMELRNVLEEKLSEIQHAELMEVS